jgi:hypothetical protein
MAVNTIHIIRKDLLLILTMVLFCAVVFGVMKYMDVQNGIVTTWAGQFYGFVLRQ